MCGTIYHGREFKGVPHPIRGPGVPPGRSGEAGRGTFDRKSKGPGVPPTLRDDDGRRLRAPGPGLDRSTPDLLSQSEFSQRTAPPSRITPTLRRTYHSTDTTGQACHMDNAHTPLSDTWTTYRPAKSYPPKPEAPHNLLQHPNSLLQKPRLPTDFWTPADRVEFAAAREHLADCCDGPPSACSVISQ